MRDTYIKTDKVWIPSESDPQCELTCGKEYPVYYDKLNKQEYIIDDVQRHSEPWLWLDGKFVK